MGGQACVLYGAAEFSRDTDFAILSTPENLAKLQPALDELQAGCIAVPPFRVRFWFLELRSPVLLREVAVNHPDTRSTLTPMRPILLALPSADDETIEAQLQAEETRERQDDRRYWAPLRRELEALRHLTSDQGAAGL
jgi:hypothetical protein